MGIERVADKSIWESRLYNIKLLLEWSGNPNLMWWNIDHQLISQVSWNTKKQELFIIFKCTWQEKLFVNYSKNKFCLIICKLEIQIRKFFDDLFNKDIPILWVENFIHNRNAASLSISFINKYFYIFYYRSKGK